MSNYPKIQAIIPLSLHDRLNRVPNKSAALRAAVKAFNEGQFKLPSLTQKEDVKVTSFSVSEEEIKIVNDLAKAHNMSAYEVVRYMLDKTLPKSEAENV